MCVVIILPLPLLPAPPPLLVDRELAEIASEQGWTVEGMVTHIRGHQEHIKPKRILAKIEFDSE